MIFASKVVPVSLLSIVLAAGAGCATASGGRADRPDLHASAHVVGDAARVLVTGPAMLLHVEIEGRDDLALYAVARKDGTEADCAASPTGERRLVRPGIPNLVNLTVAADQTLCISAVPNTRRVLVAWHARRIDAAPTVGRGEALALDANGR